MLRPARLGIALSLFVATAVLSKRASAVDVGKVDAKPVRLDVTETSVVAQHFDARDGEKVDDQGYGAWLNRLNVALRWKEWTVGTRLDSSVYWLRPIDRPSLGLDSSLKEQRDSSTRYRNAIYPAKLWATYHSRTFEATVGDAYVQFGRGLILSMRKIDELGIDNTVRGAKAVWTNDPFQLTLVGGIANPARVDEASGRALFLPADILGKAQLPEPLYGSDRLVGFEVQAGRGLPIVLSTHGVRMTRCAPYAYDAMGRVQDGVFDAPFGSCNPSDTAAWLGSLGGGSGPVLNASEVDLAGQSFEIPSLDGHGKIYVEAAVEKWKHDTNPAELHPIGNALYGAFSTNFSHVTSALEVKSYRNFYPLSGAVDVGHASAFNNIAYSNPPTTEIITQDTEFQFFNACVDGGRWRTDYRFSDAFLFYGWGAYYYSKTEQANGGCDAFGHSVVSQVEARKVAETHDDVYDAALGFEWKFDKDKSHFYGSGGARDDLKASGDPFYREGHVEYDLEKHVKGAYSIEFTGRHRLRYEQDQNLGTGLGTERPWFEGEHYSALKIAPKWAVTQGIEYTTLEGIPATYVNGSVLYRFTEASNLRLFAGQQRGGLKCVSGVCKIFPPFEGVRAELTLRF